jgi:hypothetical protein
LVADDEERKRERCIEAKDFLKCVCSWAEAVATNEVVYVRSLCAAERGRLMKALHSDVRATNDHLRPFPGCFERREVAASQKEGDPFIFADAAQMDGGILFPDAKDRSKKQRASFAAKRREEKRSRGDS